MKIDYGKITRRFLMGEAVEKPDAFSYLQSLEEALNSINPRSIKSENRLKVAKEHLRNIRKEVRNLNKQVVMLQEQVNILEESKES
tara:strand:+ start:122 stop:379 length:258 start_codon:yes stop_codon:yes gene_type:complete